MAKPALDENAFQHLAKLATQYYVAGRFCAFGQLVPVVGNLLHHAVEMYLKAVLSRTIPLSKLRPPGFGHDLSKLWAEFKGLVSNEEAERFDAAIAALHKFECLRYPDDVLVEGASIQLALGHDELVPTSGKSIEPEYFLALEDIDALVKFIFDKAQLPRAYFSESNPHFETYLSLLNTHPVK